MNGLNILWYLLILIVFMFDIYHSDMLCRDGNGGITYCGARKRGKLEDIIQVFEESISIAWCHFNNSHPVCNFLNNKNSQNRTKPVCENISEEFLVHLSYIIVIDHSNSSRILREYFRKETDDVRKTSINKTSNIKIFSNTSTSILRFDRLNYYSDYMKNLSLQFLEKSPKNCSLDIMFFVFPHINYIVRYASRQMEKQLSSDCNVSTIDSFESYHLQDANRTLNRMINEIRHFLENKCLQNNSTKKNEEKESLSKKDDPNASSVTVLVPIVIVGFIVFSCILTMRFCSEGESTLMMRAKIMKYQPEKDKQLLALIYQQIQKEGKPQIENGSFVANSEIRKSNKKSTKALDRGLFACQPCCSKDVFSAPLVGTIACVLAPLKKPT